MEKARVMPYRPSSDASGLYRSSAPTFASSDRSASQCGNVADLTRNSVVLVGQTQLLLSGSAPALSPSIVQEVILLVAE